jgi:hypothetical protein
MESEVVVVAVERGELEGPVYARALDVALVNRGRSVSGL